MQSVMFQSESTMSEIMAAYNPSAEYLQRPLMVNCMASLNEESQEADSLPVWHFTGFPFMGAQTDGLYETVNLEETLTNSLRSSGNNLDYCNPSSTNYGIPSYWQGYTNPYEFGAIYVSSSFSSENDFSMSRPEESHLEGNPFPTLVNLPENDAFEFVGRDPMVPAELSRNLYSEIPPMRISNSMSSLNSSLITNLMEYAPRIQAEGIELNENDRSVSATAENPREHTKEYTGSKDQSPLIVEDMEGELIYPPTKRQFTHEVSAGTINMDTNRMRKAMKTCSTNAQNSNSADDNSVKVTSTEQSASTSVNGTAFNTTGKPCSRRGCTEDPQSVYARNRRERINERLKVLQNLVPNGTKVDISTMLEQAIHYVKFMQLQIKLLSSEEHWMHTPIAYNAMDVALDMQLGQKSIVYTSNLNAKLVHIDIP